MPYDSQLHHAVAAGDSDQIIHYLKLGADINSIIYGLTPLIIACKRKKPDTVLTLLKHGANVHLKTWNGSTAFLAASLYSNAEIIALLKKEGGEFATRLHELAPDGNIKELEGEVKKGVPIDVLDDHRNTPLLLATAHGQLETVQWLQENGASLTAKNKYGHTALLLAAANGQLKTIQWLLKKGRASLAEKDGDGHTALLIAAAHGQLETVQWLLKKRRASLAEKDVYGHTALLIAVAHGQLETVQWLLEKGGASLAEKDGDDDTAVSIAVAYGQLETVQWLLEKGGASLAEKDKYAQAALLDAAARGQLETVQWLLEKGGASLLAAKNKFGYTALLLAVNYYCNLETEYLETEYLETEYLETEYLETEYLETVQWLLDSGASLAEKNNNGETALEIAGRHHHLNRGTVQLLVKNGAAIGQSINSGSRSYEIDIRQYSTISSAVVIGLSINNRTVTRQTPGFENAITTLKELNECKDHIDNHEALIRACRQHLAATPYKWEISLLWKRLILLWGDMLIKDDNKLKNSTLINACIKACNQRLAVNPNDPEISQLWKQLNLSSGQGLMGLCSKLIYEKQEHEAIGENIEKLPEEVKDFMKSRGQEVRTPEQISNSSTSRFTTNTDSIRHQLLQLPSAGSQALLPSGQIASIFRKKWILGSVGFAVAAIGILLILSGVGIPLGIPTVAAAIGLSVPLLSELALSIGSIICGLIIVVGAVKLKNQFYRIKIDRIKNEMGYPSAKIQTTNSASSSTVTQSRIQNPEDTPDDIIRVQYSKVLATGKRAENTDPEHTNYPLGHSQGSP